MTLPGIKKDVINEFLLISKNNKLIRDTLNVIETSLEEIAMYPDDSDWDQFLYEFFKYYDELICEIDRMIYSSRAHDNMIGHWMKKYIYDKTFPVFRNMKNVSFFISAAEYGPFTKCELRTDRLKINCGEEQKTIDVATFDDGVLDGIAFSLLLDESYCTKAMTAIINDDELREVLLMAVPSANEE